MTRNQRLLQWLNIVFGAINLALGIACRDLIDIGLGLWLSLFGLVVLPKLCGKVK